MEQYGELPEIAFKGEELPHPSPLLPCCYLRQVRKPWDILYLSLKTSLCGWWNSPIGVVPYSVLAYPPSMPFLGYPPQAIKWGRKDLFLVETLIIVSVLYIANLFPHLLPSWAGIWIQFCLIINPGSNLPHPSNSRRYHLKNSLNSSWKKYLLIPSWKHKTTLQLLILKGNGVPFKSLSVRSFYKIKFAQCSEVSGGLVVLTFMVSIKQRTKIKTFSLLGLVGLKVGRKVFSDVLEVSFQSLLSFCMFSPFGAVISPLVLVPRAPFRWLTLCQSREGFSIRTPSLSVIP